jgi:hypothetical protein
MTTTYTIRGKEIGRHDMDVIDTIDELHNSLTGAGGDPLQEHVNVLVGFLEARLEDWQPNATPWTAVYDSAVKQLLAAVLAEYREGPHIYRPKPEV